ncbi:MAG: [Fe-Fe] hydrogenase large subunit C-terminal domain-containing protein [Candidatus Bruticola sp.]
MSQGCIELKKSNCKNCYKCIRYCPSKSIRFSGNQAHVIEDECIYCGRCVVVCPQKAKVARCDVEKVKVFLAEGAPVCVSLAPSFAANYAGATIGSMREALKALGFSEIEETAIGATMVKKQYEELVAEGKQDVIISTCCHSVNLLVRRHFPEVLSKLARVVSPMVAHCHSLKERFPGCKTVFIGPCISKKHEQTEHADDVDCVLTFRELTEWLKEERITVKPGTDDNDYSKARLFPSCGGILRTMDCNQPNFDYIAIDGAHNCVNALRDIQEDKIHNCFIEMSICTGSCICGPAMDENVEAPISAHLAINKYAGKHDFVVPPYNPEELKCDHPYDVVPREQPTEEEIKRILRMVGKVSKEDELNCGCCGYNTCREKAIAVIQGKADLSMCLPYIKERAESFSDNIISNTPNGIIVLNESLEVQQINKAALSILNLRSDSAILGEKVDRVLEPQIFREVLLTNQNVLNRQLYLADYLKHVDFSVFYDNSYHILMCIMRDITAEQAGREEKEKIRQHTIEVTGQVVEKQMRVVQEIALLLGETTAETKIALTKLKESLIDESTMH